MKSLSNLLKKKFSGKNQERKVELDEKTVFFIFKKIIREEFGNTGSAMLQPDYFGKKILFVKAASSVWASELWLNRNKIVHKMNKELGEGSVQEIKTKA